MPSMTKTMPRGAAGSPAIDGKATLSNTSKAIRCILNLGLATDSIRERTITRRTEECKIEPRQGARAR
jgi:hypothetical protein